MNLGFAGFVPAVGSLVLLPVLILVRRSLYPKWFAGLTPGAFYLCALFAFDYVPAPIGSYLVIGSGSLSFLLYFAASTALLWNGGNQDTEIVA